MFNYNIDFNDGAVITLEQCDDVIYNIDFINNDNGEILQSNKLKSFETIKTDIKYYINWKVVISHNDIILVSHNMNLNNKHILIKYESKSLGDTISWLPYIEEFRIKHDCNISCSIFMDLFKNSYPNINFIKPGDNLNLTYATYSLGWFNQDIQMNPSDYKKIPLQQTSSDILGLDFKEIVPKIDFDDNYKKPNYKYVCIAQYSTANTKHWHYPVIDSNNGWQIIVDWLNDNGYRVMIISQQSTDLKNIIDKTGNYPLQQRMSELKYSEFFISVSSGLSWLSWVMNKKTVLISGFTDPICEFKTNCIRIINNSVCNGCLTNNTFDRGDWNWCPIHKNTKRQFECSLSITPKYIIDKIISSELVDIKSEFKEKVDNVTINDNDIDIKYNDRLEITMNTTIKNIYINIIDEYGKTLFVKYYDKLIEKNMIWFKFNDFSNLYYIKFYTKNKLIVEYSCLR